MRASPRGSAAVARTVDDDDAMIRMTIVFIVVFLVATFPATWLLMLFLGNLGTGLSYWGAAAARDPGVGAARQRRRRRSTSSA